MLLISPAFAKFAHGSYHIYFSIFSIMDYRISYNCISVLQEFEKRI